MGCSSLNLDGQWSAKFSIVSRDKLGALTGKNGEKVKNRDLKEKYGSRNLGMWKMKGIKPNGKSFQTEVVRKNRRAGSSEVNSQISIDILVKE
jgi:hypothetical protein